MMRVKSTCQGSREKSRLRTVKVFKISLKVGKVENECRQNIATYVCHLLAGRSVPEKYLSEIKVLINNVIFKME